MIEDTQSIAFASAKGGYLDQLDPDLFDNPNMKIELKYDGARYRLIVEQGNNTLQSRRVSDVTGEFVEKTDRVPHITGLDLSAWNGTMVEGEIITDVNQSSKEVTSIMGCNPEKAIERQKERGWLHWIMFDIKFFKGLDLRSFPESERRKYLEKFYEELGKKIEKNYEFLHVSQQYKASDHPDGLLGMYNKFVDQGFEGGMLKDSRAAYGDGWYKVKRICDLDVFVTGYTAAKEGKYEGLIGAVTFGVIDEKGVTHEISQCSGMDDATRVYITNNKEALMNQPLTIKCQEVTRTKKGGYSVRHPRFDRWRPDIGKSNCTLEKILIFLKD